MRRVESARWSVGSVVRRHLLPPVADGAPAISLEHTWYGSPTDNPISQISTDAESRDEIIPLYVLWQNRRASVSTCWAIEPDIPRSAWQPDSRLWLQHGDRRNGPRCRSWYSERPGIARTDRPDPTAGPSVCATLCLNACPCSFRFARQTISERLNPSERRETMCRECEPSSKHRGAIGCTICAVRTVSPCNHEAGVGQHGHRSVRRWARVRIAHSSASLTSWPLSGYP